MKTKNTNTQKFIRIYIGKKEKLLISITQIFECVSLQKKYVIYKI